MNMDFFLLKKKKVKVQKYNLRGNHDGRKFYFKTIRAGVCCVQREEKIVERKELNWSMPHSPISTLLKFNAYPVMFL